MLSLGGIENLERHERKSVYGCYPEKSLNIKKKDEVFPSNDKIFFVFIRKEEEIKVNTDHIRQSIEYNPSISFQLHLNTCRFIHHSISNS
jgi:hypothetical protein